MATAASAAGLVTATSPWRRAGVHRHRPPTKRAPHPNPSRPRQRTRAMAAAAMQEEDSEFVRCAAGERLRDWIVENGGVVHPSLAVVTATRNTGSRGVVALQPISVETTSSEPLVLVPESLYLTSQVARVGFEYYEKQGAPKLELLDKPSQLALLLAHEKPQGADSFFYPYVDALPDRPSAAWALDDVQLDAALAALPAAVTAEERAKWRQEAIRQRGVIQTHSQRVEERYQKFCPITAKDFFWAMGHVLSRSYGSHPQLGMAPFIDLLNHNVKASAPELAWDEEVEEAQREFWYFVTAVEDGECVGMQRGDELYVSYSPNTSPQMMFMSYGFVPPELLS